MAKRACNGEGIDEKKKKLEGKILQIDIDTDADDING